MFLTDFFSPKITAALNSQRMGTYLWNPQGTANMDPLGAAPGRLHGATLLGTQQTLGLNAKRAGPAQPAAFRHLQDPVTRLDSHVQKRQRKQRNQCVFLLLFSCLHIASRNSQNVLYAISNTIEHQLVADLINLAKHITYSFPKKIFSVKGEEVMTSCYTKKRCPLQLGK